MEATLVAFGVNSGYNLANLVRLLEALDMITVNMLDAKTHLSEYVRLLESGQEDCIVIARHNKPVAKMTAYVPERPKRRLGIAEGKVLYTDEWDSPEFNEEIARMFGVE